MSTRPIYSIRVYQEDAAIAVLEDANEQWIDSITVLSGSVGFEHICRRLGAIIDIREKVKNATNDGQD